MLSMPAADRLEFALAELRHAIANLEVARAPEAPPGDDSEDFALAALRKARTILEDAQLVAERQGLCRLAIF